jgi:hypothetical protein
VGSEEIQPFRGSLSSGLGRREASSKTDRKASWVEAARQEAQKQEASGSNVSSQEGPCHTTGFVSLIEGASNQEDCSTVVVADLVQEANPLPVWETDVRPDDGGWNTHLTKREC